MKRTAKAAARDRAEVTQMAGSTSKGFAEPAALRRAANVVGISCSDAVLITTKRAMLRLTPFPPFSAESACMASIPMGVAAFPSPRRLAVRFMQTALFCLSARPAPGKQAPDTGTKDFRQQPGGSCRFRRFQKAGPCHHGAGHGQGEFHGILCAGKNGFRQRTHSSCCKRANQAHQNHASPDNIQQGFRLLFQLII